MAGALVARLCITHTLEPAVARWCIGQDASAPLVQRHSARLASSSAGTSVSLAAWQKSQTAAIGPTTRRALVMENRMYRYARTPSNRALVAKWSTDADTKTSSPANATAEQSEACRPSCSTPPPRRVRTSKRFTDIMDNSSNSQYQMRGRRPGLPMKPFVLVLYLLGLGSTPPTSLAEGAVLFVHGVTWEQFLRSVRVQRRLWEDTAARTEISPEFVERLKRVSSGLRILIVTEDWCSDSVHTVPYVARLAERAGIDLRIVDRTIGKPIMSRHRTLDHRVATPVVLLIRNDRDAGAWVERPSALQASFLAMRNQHDSQRLTRKEEWYVRDRGDSTLAEIVALAERAQRER